MSKWSSFKETKVLFENFRKFVSEDAPITERRGRARQRKKIAKRILRNNQHLAHTADHLRDNNLVDAGRYIFLHFPPGQLPAHPQRGEDKGSFGHVRASHTRTSDLTGSKFDDNLMSDEALTRLVVDFLKNNPKPDEKDTNKFGTKLKWFNTEMKQPIGIDSIVKKDDSSGTPRDYEYKEKIGNNRGIPSIMSQGVAVVDVDGNTLSSPEMADPEGVYFTKQIIPVVDGPLQPTKRMNLIVADLGKVAGQTLVSLVTMFPGVSEPTAFNKQDYAKMGYYFLTGKQ